MNNYIFPFDKVEKNSEIVLYGAGSVGQCFYKQIVTTNYCDVTIWVDKNNQAFQDIGIDIKPIDALATVDEASTVVIAIENFDVRKSVYDFIIGNYPNIPHSKIIYEGQYGFPDRAIPDCTNDELLKLDLKRIKTCNKSINELNEDKYNSISIKNRRFINGKQIEKLATIEIATRDLVLAQYRNWDFSNYMHYDMAVRAMAYEEISSEACVNGGLDLYKRMQATSGFDWTDRYTKLIENVAVKGFDKESKVELDRNLMIMDGSHRVTLAYKNGIDFIKADVYDCDRDRNFGIDFFWENGFSVEECKAIIKEQEEILETCSFDFEGVIWPSAYKIADEVVDFISKYDPENIEVASWQDIVYDKDDFYYLFKALYFPDVIDEAGMELKFMQIEKCMGEAAEYPTRFFSLHVKQPRMSVNEKNRMPQSLTIKRLKKAVRTRLSHLIENYEYDVMVHIADNYYQTRFATELLQLDRDVSGIVEYLDNFKYVAVKMYGRQHKLFPYYYYYWGDFDIVVMENDLKKVVSCVEEYLKNKYHKGWQKVECTCLEPDGSVVVWLKIDKLEVFGVHIQTVKRFGMDYEINESLIEQREKKECGIYSLPIEEDAYIRLAEYIRKPYKKHHYNFIVDNRDFFSREKIEKYWGRNQDMRDNILRFLKGEGIIE